MNSTWTDNYDASSWGNVCPGTGISSTPNVTLGQDYTLDEDCLNIKSVFPSFFSRSCLISLPYSIIRPAGVTEGDKLPVLFWMYVRSRAAPERIILISLLLAATVAALFRAPRTTRATTVPIWSSGRSRMASPL